MKNALLALLLVGLVACQDEETERICIAPPCGEIESSSFNISFVFEGKSEDFSSIIWMVGESIEQLNLSGSDGGISCWNQASVFPSESSVNKIVYTKSNLISEIMIDANEIQSNAIRVEILASQNNYYDWTNDCRDTEN